MLYKNIDTIRRAFDSRDFTPGEAAWILNVKSATSALARLKEAGLIERVGRGRYRLAPPEGAMRILDRYRREVVRRILELPVALALDGPDAVSVWTGGRYTVGKIPGNDVLYLAVDRRYRARFSRLLREMRVPWGTAERWPRGKGILVIVRFVDRLRRAIREDVPVLTKDEVLRIIRADPSAYEGAQDWVVR